MNLQEITISPISWKETIFVRNQVLWSKKNPEFSYVKGDEDAVHFGALLDDKIVCVASIFIHKKKARLRKFATLEKFQKMGIGSKVLKFIFDTLKEKGITYFWCDARKSATNFYENFGLRSEGEDFYKSDVLYTKMFKHL
jgi:GNAT superfamily N-acetyltransferase